MIRAPPSVIAGGGVCCFRQQHPLWHRRGGEGLPALAGGRRRGVQGFFAGGGGSFLPHNPPSPFPSLFNARNALRHYLPPRHFFLYYKTNRLPLKYLPNHPRVTPPRQSRSWWGISVPARCQNHAKSAAVII